MKKLRILHLPIIISYQPYLFTQGLRKLGHTVDYMAINAQKDMWLMQGAPDTVLKVKGISHIFKLGWFYLKSLFKYDVFHYHSVLISTLLLKKYPKIMRMSSFFEINILRLFGKKVIINFWGCDIRIKEVNEKYEYNTCDVCSLYGTCNSEFKKWFDEFTKKYAHIRLSGGDLLAMFQDCKKINVAINTELWNPSLLTEIPTKFQLEKSDSIKVFSCLGNSVRRGDIRGLEYVDKAIKELQKEGYNVERIFFDKVKNTDLRYYQMQADICVDQLRYGFHAISALESMSLSKPVIGYMRDVVRQEYPDVPIINATPVNVKDVLKKIIDDREEGRRIGKISRQYVLEHHSVERVAKSLEKYYNSIK